MSLSIDAQRYDIAETLMNISILKQIEDDLDIDEKISILFLIIEDYADAFEEIFNLFQKAKTGNTHIIVDYVNNHLGYWEEKVLEALCILNNQEVIRKLKISLKDLDLQYFPKIRSCSKNINVIAKCLYLLCESLDESEQKQLVNYVKLENTNYGSMLDCVDYLELHLLYWMKIKYITISTDGRHDMRKLLKYLKGMNNIKTICMDLERCTNHLHVVDTYGPTVVNDKTYLQSIPAIRKQHLTNEHDYKKTVRHINSGLCIIINQMYFQEEYEARFGTTADCISISETFQDFGFTIHTLENLNKKEILEKIKNIPKEYGNKYDCLFLCILSHGYRGGIIASDEKEVSLEAIERTLCCMELKDIMKIVIIQACQGEIRGNINNDLVTDGLSDSSPSVSDIRAFANFFLFMSTMQGFVSIRHKEQGSWFIQEVCKILKTHGNQQTFLECVREIMKSVKMKKGTMEGSQIAQLSEIRQDRLESDFQLKSIVPIS